MNNEHEHKWTLAPLQLWGQEYYPPAPPVQFKYSESERSTGRNREMNQYFKVEVCVVEGCGLIRVPEEVRQRIVDSSALEWKGRRKEEQSSK